MSKRQAVMGGLLDISWPDIGQVEGNDVHSSCSYMHCLGDIALIVNLWNMTEI